MRGSCRQFDCGAAKYFVFLHQIFSYNHRLCYFTVTINILGVLSQRESIVLVFHGFQVVLLLPKPRGVEPSRSRIFSVNRFEESFLAVGTKQASGHKERRRKACKFCRGQICLSDRRKKFEVRVGGCVKIYPSAKSVTMNI